ncbi:MAG: hypothetical protein M9952_01055 [Microthrixaceae bacterium]|nr:hypothetical protein [Microthrixaceae bacterium]MCO5311519.1 hypothetical protein [Microthrixaceae bacterium]HPB44354.1 hypothetical protein [Microthrixaceae bacterium]
MRIGVLGLGVVGQRLIELLDDDSVSTPVVVTGRVHKDREALRRIHRDHVELVEFRIEADATFDVDVVVLASPDEHHATAASAALAGGAHVVSLADSAATVTELLSLNEFAREVGRSVVVGAAASPGVSTLLAIHAGTLFSRIDQVDIAVTGTAGPTCIDRRARANRTETQEWRDAMWVDCGARSAPELVFFPDPVGSIECARGDLSESLVLRRVMPNVDLLSIKVAKEPVSPVQRAGRRSRRPEREIEPGAQRIMVSGEIDGVPETVVYGLVASTRDISADLAQLCAWAALSEQRSGAMTVGELVDAPSTLRMLADRGSQMLVYEDLD